MADDFVALKCPSCGASNLDVDGDVVTCPYCGARQARVDAQKYVEQIKTEVLSFVSKAFPVGMTLSQTENMDPVARHNIFQQNVRPTIESLFREYRFEFTSSINQQLIAVPYRVLPKQNNKYGTKQMFEFDEKIKTVSPLAVDEPSKELLKTASAVAMSYASLLNNLNLISEDEPDRYGLMMNNYKAALESLEGVPEYEIVGKRFQGLLTACEGFKKLMDGNYPDAKALLTDAVGILEEVQTEAASNIDFGSMGYSVKKEIVVLNTGITIAEAFALAPGINTEDALLAVRNFMDELTAQEQKIGSVGGQWTTLIKRSERFNDVFTMFKDVIRAKTGESIVRIAAGEGEYYMPMWVVDIKYSFVNGFLFFKKAVKVSDTVLVSAMFTTDEETFMNPSFAITDIFGNTPQSAFKEMAKGTKSSLTGGSGLKAAVDGSATGSVNASADIIVPVSTKQEAELLCKEYLAECKSSMPKLTMGSPVVKELLFVPCNIAGGNVKLAIDVGNFTVKKYGDMETISKLSI